EVFYTEHRKTVQKVVYAGHDEPVYTEVMYNGHVERTPQYRWKPGQPSRTEQDMIGEMKRELLNLPRYTAYCKIVQEVNGKQVLSKYELHPYHLSKSDDEAIVSARIEYIRA